MRLFYRIAYRLGFTPWERAAAHPPAAAQIAALFDREQEERELPLGSALDLGCGSGIWSVELARRGWQVTGIDIVPTAVSRARERARRAGVEVRIVEGDVTALQAAGIGAGFRLIWDFGTVHGLSPAQRQAVAQEVSAVAAPDAVMLSIAWMPGRRGPLPRGVSRDELEVAFAGWAIVDEGAFDASGLPRPLRKVKPEFYRLRRTAPTAAPVP